MFLRTVLVSSVVTGWWLIAGISPAAQSHDEFDRARRLMVAEYLQKEGIKNARVLDAMRTVPRHEFMPASLRRKAYEDAAFLIGYKQTISPPFVVAYMTQSLDPRPTDRVLEIGTGSGYQAAVLSHLVKEVYSIEIVEPLGREADKRLKRLGYSNVKTRVGDGYKGWPEQAPFDKIIVTCSPERIPQPLVDQLREGGRLIIPLGERYQQDLFLVEKERGKLVRKQLIPTLFVPMTGRSDAERTIKPEPFRPQVNNGGFEQREPDGQPVGWHYVRQMTVVEEDAPEGRYCVRFANDDPGRTAQALQGMAVDGQRLDAIKFTLKAKGEQIEDDGPASFSRATLQVHFYDQHRRAMGDAVVARWSGSFPWHTVSGRMPVPLAAREMIVRVGLNGARGRLYIDDIKLAAEPR